MVLLIFDFYIKYFLYINSGCPIYFTTNSPVTSPPQPKKISCEKTQLKSELRGLLYKINKQGDRE